MFERLKDVISKRQAETAQVWLAQDGKIEELVHEGRPPMFIPSQIIDSRGNPTNRILVVVPPQGVDFRTDEVDDQIPGGGWEFFSTDGVSKGLGELYDIDIKLGKKLQKRREMALLHTS